MQAAATEFKGFSVSWTGQDGAEESGPLELLWQLIESYRVDIFDISLIQITSDFIHFLRSSEDLQIELASSFSVMAARLLYYKSKALLPDPGFEDSEEDPRLPPELIEQLLEYRKFQMAGERMRELETVVTGIVSRPASGLREVEGEWLDVSLLELLRAYQGLIERVSISPAALEIEQEEVSVEERMDQIRMLLLDAVSFSFHDLFENFLMASKMEIIASFLALLELVKLGEVLVRQSVACGEITVFKKEITIN
ncbi:MAG: segregation/condensation protein A [Spirochaetales bacterium]|nr:segregation/condensation protein A [Spirochaetales bacterium]